MKCLFVLLLFVVYIFEQHTSVALQKDDDDARCAILCGQNGQRSPCRCAGYRRLDKRDVWQDFFGRSNSIPPIPARKGIQLKSLSKLQPVSLPQLQPKHASKLRTPEMYRQQLQQRLEEFKARMAVPPRLMRTKDFPTAIDQSSSNPKLLDRIKTKQERLLGKLRKTNEQSPIRLQNRIGGAPSVGAPLPGPSPTPEPSSKVSHIPVSIMTMPATTSSPRNVIEEKEEAAPAAAAAAPATGGGDPSKKGDGLAGTLGKIKEKQREVVSKIKEKIKLKESDGNNKDKPVQ